MMYPPVMAERIKTLEIESAAFTDPGSQRDLNQDVVFHQTGQTGQGETMGLFLVCDGIGGHRGGEIASRIAAAALCQQLIAQAKARDGSDNISAIVADFKESEGC